MYWQYFLGQFWVHSMRVGQGTLDIFSASIFEQGNVRYLFFGFCSRCVAPKGMWRVN